jgi:hypothetical protein
LEKSIKYWIFLSVIFACTIFLCFKQLKNNNWNRCISSDGKGYYAYLPAIFIYHDLQFKFINYYEEKYYQLENKVTFTNIIDDKQVNKYWIGTALMMSPFFAIAHFMASITNKTNDGYSFIYQTMIAIGAIFYLLLGLFFMRKLLLLYSFTELTIFITLFAIVFATNLFYYTVAEPSMSHVYSMAAISSLAYFIKKYFDTNISKYLNYAILLFCLIVLIRPSNAIIVFSLPLFVGSIKYLKKSISSVNFLIHIPTLLLAVLLISIQFIYYKVAVGSYFVYSYGQEKFNFLNPHFIDFLFSYRRGLFLYSPILLFALLGLIPMSRKSVFQTKALLFFLLTIIYILSSWWMWYYGGSFGMRPIIDYFVFFAIPLAFLTSYFLQKKFIKWMGIALVLTCVITSLTQTYQKVNFILPWDGINKEIYWEIFLKTNPSFIGKYTNKSHAQ